MPKSPKKQLDDKSAQNELEDPLPGSASLPKNSKPKKPKPRRAKKQLSLKKLGLRMLGDTLHISEGAKEESGDLFFEEIPMQESENRKSRDVDSQAAPRSRRSKDK